MFSCFLFATLVHKVLTSNSSVSSGVRCVASGGVLLKGRIGIDRVLCFLFPCVLLAGLLSGCAETPQENMIYTTSGYNEPISKLFPDCKVTGLNRVKLDFLHEGGVIEAYDAQLENIAAKYWYPLTLETIVIAVDRDQTDMAITSWSDLPDSDVAVSILDTVPMNHLAVAALCYGYEGRNSTLDPAVKLLQPLNTKKLLKFDSVEAPIQICFDSAAAARIIGGENVEIVIPSEGTLSFIKGLLSNEPLSLPVNAEQILLEHGLRLVDGRCDETVYPAHRQYAPASLLTLDCAFRTDLITVTQDWMRVLRRDILHKRLYTSADQREHILFAVVFIILAVMWIGSMMRRSQQKTIRSVIFIMGILLVGWVLTRVIKYQIIDENALTRYIWYGYYIFQSFLSLGLLRIAALIGTGSENKHIPKWLRTLLAFNLVLVGLVVTNDLHGMMFRLDISQQGWSNNYSYGILFYVVMAVMLLQLIGGIVLMFVKTKHSPRRFGVIFPLLFTAALITYCTGYILRVPVFAESDMTLIICTFALLFLELCIRAGQIPVNTHYRDLFENTGFDLQITDKSGVIVFASSGAAPLDAGQWEKLKKSTGPVQIDENILLLINEIAGGYAVWRKDVAVINKLKEEIAVSNREIEAANALLSNEARSREETARTNTRVELFASFEKHIATHEKRLAGLIESASQNNAKYAENLRIATLLTCYIKRRSYFLCLAMDEYKTVSYNEFVVYIDEMAELARLAGIECLTYCNLSGEIRLDRVMLFYDFWASLLEWAIENRESEIISQTMSEDGRIIMRLTTGDSAMNYEPYEELAQEIDVTGGILDKTVDTEIGFTVLQLAFPEDTGDRTEDREDREDSGQRQRTDRTADRGQRQMADGKGQWKEE